MMDENEIDKQNNRIIEDDDHEEIFKTFQATGQSVQQQSSKEEQRMTQFFNTLDNAQPVATASVQQTVMEQKEWTKEEEKRDVLEEKGWEEEINIAIE